MAPSKPPLRLLLLDDDEALRQSLARRFERQGAQVCQAGTVADALALAEKQRFDVGLVDLNLPDGNGIDALGKLKGIQPELEILMLTAHGSLETAIEAVKRGAYHYLTKPPQLADLDLQIEKALEKSQLARRERQLVAQLAFESDRYRLVGSSPRIRKVMQLIEKVAPTDASVLIRGASGTGKELVARALHNNSQRRQRPLVTVNCAALQETLLESELFGHEKGSFTGATLAKEGLIEVADGGTLFIDEIAEMAPGMQAKLLRVLENGHYRRVGATREGHADVRIVAATNKCLEEEQKAGRFREDLFYRLNVVTIELPTLKERAGDIPELVEHFLKTRRVGSVPFAVEPEAMQALLRYDWPGNVRELANVLERAQILAENHTIALDDLPSNLADAHPPSPADDHPLRLREVERRHVLEVLRLEKGNKVHAAKTLGISRRALYRLVAKHHITPEQMGSEE